MNVNVVTKAKATSALSRDGEAVSRIDREDRES
jgi:hypothetical protein